MTSTTFFIIFIPILAIILLAVNLILAPHNPYQEKDSVFECGFHSFLGQNRTQFSVSFFIFGLLFLLFDLEILLVYPYSVSSYTNDIYGLVIMMVFFVLLTLGFIFELGKNALTIDSRQTSSYNNADTTTPVSFIAKSYSTIQTSGLYINKNMYKLSINRNFLIGLISSIITAAMGYILRLILLNYLEYDVFTHLDNWTVSLSYFCSLGGSRFVINEWLKENMYSCGGTLAVSNPTVGSGSLPVGTNPVGNISTMQAPNDPGIGSSTPAGSSGALITDDRLKLQQKLAKVQGKLQYFDEQYHAARFDLHEIESKRDFYIARGEQQLWQTEHQNAVSALNDCSINATSELRMKEILETKLNNGDYSMSAVSDTTKRSFADSSMSNDDSSTRINKRTSDNQ